MVSAFRSFANPTSHTLRRSFGWKNGKLLEDSVFRTVPAATSYYVATCHHAVCVPWAHWPYFGDAKQAMGEGKSGPVEAGLTGVIGNLASPVFGTPTQNTPSKIR